jgi:hypothetical protein
MPRWRGGTKAERSCVAPCPAGGAQRSERSISLTWTCEERWEGPAHWADPEASSRKADMEAVSVMQDERSERHLTRERRTYL